MSTRFCERCQQTVPARGLHACVPVTKAKASSPVTAPTNAIVHPTNNPTNGPTNKSDRKRELRKAQVYRWRQRNADRYRAYMRDHMKRRRDEALAKAARGTEAPNDRTTRQDYHAERVKLIDELCLTSVT